MSFIILIIIKIYKISYHCQKLKKNSFADVLQREPTLSLPTSRSNVIEKLNQMPRNFQKTFIKHSKGCVKIDF